MGIGLALSVTLVHPDPALAAEGSGQSQEALRLGQEALQLYSQSRWQEALNAFTAADQAMHSPVFGLYRARCQKSLGHWIEARLTLEVVADRKLGVGSPQPWYQAQIAAAEELAELNGTIPKVDFELASGENPNLLVTIDGDPVQLVEGKARRELNPGKHQITVRRNGVNLESRDFESKPGAENPRFQLGPYRPARAAVTLPAYTEGARVTPQQLGHPAPLNRPRAATPSSTMKTAAYAPLAVGLLGVCIGAVTGIVAWRKRDNLRDGTCDGTYDCPDKPSVRRELELGKAYGNLSTAAFTAAGVGFASAGLLFYLAPSSAQKQSALGLGFTGRF